MAGTRKKTYVENAEKDRLYVLTTKNPPMQYFLRNRHKQKAPLTVYDSAKNKSRVIRYATNQMSIYEDEQYGDAILGYVVFKNGKLEVKKENPLLQEFLKIHPFNGTIFVEHNAEDIASKQLSDLEVEAEALKVAFDLGIDELENIAISLYGKKVSKMKSSEIKRDVLLYAKSNPKNFLHLAADDATQLKALGIRAVELGLLSYKDYSFYNGENLICRVPYDQKDEYETLARWLRTTEGLKFQDYIHSKLK